MAGYTTVDITLRQRLLHDRLEWSLIARNAFDEDVREPSAYGEPVAMPDDFPMAGRSFMGEISYNF